jgi:toxin YoeB
LAEGKSPSSAPARLMVIQPECLEDLQFWASTNQRVTTRLLRLMAEVMRTPFEGTGKPERLKHWKDNAWSRRITEADRLVYVVQNDRIDFIQARYHYED